MKIGNLSVSLLSAGTTRLDGGVVFGSMPKSKWRSLIPSDRKNRVQLSANCLLIQSPDANILVDTGLGNNHPEFTRERDGFVRSKLVKQLRAKGISTRDIDIVLLTHLHYDVCGGGIAIDRRGRTVPAFPKAKYLVQRDAWEEAHNPGDRSKDSFLNKDLMALFERRQMVLLDGDSEVSSGIHVQVTNGHSSGYQIVYVHNGGQRLIFMGDLIPTSFHLEPPCIAAYDLNPEDTLRAKKKVLQYAEEKGWMIAFGRDPNQDVGFLERRNGSIQLRSLGNGTGN